MLDIVLSRQIDPGREVVAMLCSLAAERQGDALPEARQMPAAREHLLASPALAHLAPALDALAELEAHVLCGLEVDEARLARLFAAPKPHTAPAIYLYAGLTHGFSAERCAYEILLSMRDDEFAHRNPDEPQAIDLASFVRSASSAGEDRGYVMNLTQMLACWDEEIAWLRSVLDAAIPRFEEKLPLVQPFVDAWADAIEARLPQMRKTGVVCDMLCLQNDSRRCVIVPAVRNFPSLILSNPEPDGTRLIQYGLLIDSIAAAMPEIEDSQLLVRLRALGDKRRLKIVRALVSRPLCASEVAQLTQLSPATVSHHMSELLNASLVTAEEAGSRLRYHLNAAGMRKLIADLSDLLSS